MLTATLVARDLDVLDDGRQVGIVAAARPRVAALLAARSAGGSRGRRRRRGRGAGLRLAAEELLLAEAQLGAELFDLLLEKGFALDGAIMHGLPVTGLSPRLERLGQVRADGAGSARKGRGGTGKGWGRGEEGHAPRVRGNRAGQRS